jgi:heme exporter protein D
MNHYAFYINTSYAAAGLIVLCLIAWVWLDGRVLQKELKALEASGIRRRSASGKAKP